MDLKATQRANALLASGELMPGNPLHTATLAGRPGYTPVYQPCCGSPDGCYCPLEDKIAVIREWKRMSLKVQRRFPPGHPFRLDL